LAFHGAKLNVMKCEFAKGKILFLGWYITHDYIVADPRRVEKIREFPFPNSKKAIRGFLGLVNSLRRVANIEVIRQMSILTPLTSSKGEFKPTDTHRRAFEEIKKMMISEPLFCNLVDIEAEKFLFVDAATSTGVLGSVLLQRIHGNTEKVIPEYLDLDNEVHRIIFDKSLPYEPVKLVTSLPVEKIKPTAEKTVPPNVSKEDRLCGYTDSQVNDSFFWSTVSIIALYNGPLPSSVKEYRVLAAKKLKSGVLNNKLKDFVFNLDLNRYRRFMEDFTNGKVGLDPNFYLAEALAESLYRPMVIISTLERHCKKPIMRFNQESVRPPLIYGVVLREGHEIFIPFFHNKNSVFKLDQLRGKVQIISFAARTIPSGMKALSILDQESLAVVVGIFSHQRFISGAPVTLLTDSRVLFYLFSSRVHNSSAKIQRWCLKLNHDFSNVRLQFVRTTENLADFLTRQGLKPGDLPKLNLKLVGVNDFYDFLPKDNFSLPEWVEFVDAHPEYLTVNQPGSPSLKAIVNAIERGIDNLEAFSTPLMVLQERLSRAEFVRNQRIEHTDIYNLCLSSENFECTIMEGEKQVIYRLTDNLLFTVQNIDKIVVPPSMVGVLLAHCHLYGHKGLPRMLANLESYHFDHKYTIVRKFIGSCYGCFLSQTANRHVKLGTYPLPERPFQTIMMDICENLNPTRGGYQHLLIVQCVLTDFVIIIPLRTKKASEIEHMLNIAVLQQRAVETIVSDNGPGYRSIPHLSVLAALHIKVVNTASLSPIGRGKIERLVGIVKIMMKRILATKPTYNWQYIPLICAVALNTTVSPRTGFKPAVMVGGTEGAGLTFLELEGMAPPHHMVKNNKMRIEQLHQELQQSLSIAKSKVSEVQEKRIEISNKNKVNRIFKENDYVFVLDRAQIPGATRPLKTKLQSTPYIVLSVRHTSCVVKRMSDGFTAMYSMNDLKKYEGGNPYFKDLPPEVKEVLIHKFSDLLAEDLTTLAKYDPLEVPDALKLFDLEEGEPVQTNSKDTVKTSEPPEEEAEILDYLNKLGAEDVRQDLTDLQTEGQEDQTKPLFRQADLGSDESEEENEEQNAWEGRLRNRTGKRVRFA